MKEFYFIRIIRSCLFAGMIVFTSCEDVKTTKNDECEETKWSSPKNPFIYLELAISWDTVGRDGMMSFISHHATWAVFSGSITKIYCDGTVSSTFSFSPTFYPDQMSPQDLLSGFFLPQPYQFKFEHDKDYLQLIYRIKYFFDKANVSYESMEITQRVYYKNLNYEYTVNSNYIPINIDEETAYVKVTN
jgi:hypothetical protein